MFGANTISNSLSIGKVLNGISKGLSIANQVIPLYQQVKPMVGNARKILHVLKEFNHSNNNNNNNVPIQKTINQNNEESNLKQKKNSSITIQSTPVFFQ